MTNEEMNKIQSIMKKVFLISAAVYALFVLCVFVFLGKVLTPTQLVLIVIFAPMVVGLLVLFIFKMKHPPVLDDSEVDFEEEIIETEKETQD